MSKWKVELGERLRNLREKRNHTPAEFAGMLGVSRPTIVHWEAGTRSPNPEQIAKIAALLRTSSDYLIGITDNPLAPNEVMEVEEIMNNVQLTYKNKPISDEYKKMFLRFFESIDYGKEEKNNQ